MYPVLTTVSHIPRRTINLYTNKNIILKLPYMLRYNILRFDSTVTATSLAVCVCVWQNVHIYLFSKLTTGWRIIFCTISICVMAKYFLLFVSLFNTVCCVVDGWTMLQCVYCYCVQHLPHTHKRAVLCSVTPAIVTHPRQMPSELAKGNGTIEERLRAQNNKDNLGWRSTAQHSTHI